MDEKQSNKTTKQVHLTTKRKTKLHFAMPKLLVTNFLFIL